MVEVYKNLYRMGIIDAQIIEDMVIYVPDFGFTPLDYENITGKPWPQDKQMTNE